MNEPNHVKSLEQLFESIVGESGSELINSQGEKLNDHPIKLALDICEHFWPVFKRTTSSEPELLNVPIVHGMQDVLFKSIVIKSSYESMKADFKKLKNSMLSEEFPLVTEEELVDVENLLNPNTLKPADPEFQALTNREEMRKGIILSYRNNELRKYDFLSAGEIDIEELEKISLPAAELARKTAFNKVCENIFQYNGNLDFKEHSMVEIIPPNHNINELSEFPIPKNHVGFAYVNCKPMSEIKTPRFGVLLNSREGQSYKIENSYHKKSVLNVVCILAGQEVSVRVPIWQGLITGEVQ